MLKTRASGTPRRPSSTDSDSGAQAVAFGPVQIWLTQMPDSRGKLFGQSTDRRRRSAQLHVVRRGALTLREPAVDGALETFTPGQAFFTLGGGVPMIAHRESEVLTVAVPAERLSSSTPDEGPMRVNSVLLAPTVDFVSRTMLIVQGSGFSDQHLQELIPRMMEGLLVDSNGAVATGPTKASVYLQATAVLAQRYADPGLTVEAIASAVSLSPRQLQRTFRARGTTIHGELRSLRVEKACRMLRDHRYDALTLDEVAKHVGFGDRSSLARATAVVGLPAPSRIRREAAGG